MNYSDFKKSQALKYHSVNSAIKVKSKLTGLTLNGEKIITEAGTPYQATLVPQSGKYLPRVIDITGTKSRYAFKYDYTTGVIYIPSDEIYEDITVIAEADTVNNNVPAVLQVQKISMSSHYVDGVKYTSQSFLALNVAPSRGSTVSVTFDGVTKTLTGSLSTTKYDSASQFIVFGLYGTVDDGTTATSGSLTISGAYETYCLGTYNDNKGVANYDKYITGITELGSIRYLSGPLNCDGAFSNDTLTFARELDEIKAAVAYASPGDKTRFNVVFNKYVKKISSYLIDGKGNSGNSGNSAHVSLNAYFNNIDWDWWAQGNRGYYLRSPEGNDYLNYSFIPYINGTMYNNISSVTLSQNCTFIGEYAFAYLQSMTDIILPDSIESINSSAFQKSGLTTIKLSNSLKLIGSDVFAGTKITSITLPESLETIESRAFFGTEITSLTIPKNVKTLGNTLCSRKSGFVLTISDDNLYYSAENNVVYNKDMTKLMDGYLYVSSAALVIPSTVTAIAQSAFRDNPNLTSVTIPSSIVTWGGSEFYGCTALSEVVLKDGLQQIGNYSFRSCSALTAITIPGSVKTIGSYAFNNCTTLSNITLTNGIEEISNYVFCQSSITSINIPSSVNNIGNNVFATCTVLSSVILNEGLIKIGSKVFTGCTALTSITIPSTVTTMGHSCFYNCSNLAKITMLPTTPPVCNPFGESDDTADTSTPPSVSYQIVVPKGCGDAYKATAGWSNFANHIVEAS